MKRLVIGSNDIIAFESISDLLHIPALVEISMESNPICQDQYYRAILINRIKTLKILDGRKISDDERRSATRIAKREAERRKENDRVTFQYEERYLAYLEVDS